MVTKLHQVTHYNMSYCICTVSMFYIFMHVKKEKNRKKRRKKTIGNTSSKNKRRGKIGVGGRGGGGATKMVIRLRSHKLLIGKMLSQAFLLQFRSELLQDYRYLGQAYVFVRV